MVFDYHHREIHTTLDIYHNQNNPNQIYHNLQMSHYQSATIHDVVQNILANACP